MKKKLLILTLLLFCFNAFTQIVYPTVSQNIDLGSKVGGTVTTATFTFTNNGNYDDLNLSCNFSDCPWITSMSATNTTISAGGKVDITIGIKFPSTAGSYSYQPVFSFSYNGTNLTMGGATIYLTSTGGGGNPDPTLQIINNFTAFNLVSDGFSLRWDAVTGSDITYKIWVSGTLKITTTSTSATITGLNTDQLYNAQIEAYQGNSRIGLSPVITVGNFNITASNIASTGFSINWNSVNASNVTYKVWVNGKLITTTTNTNSTITGLNPSQNYNVQIEAYQGSSRVGLSPVVTITTMSWSGNISATDIKCSDLTLNWDAIPGTNITYKIWVDGNLFSTTTGTVLLVTGLISNQSHDIQIEAYQGSSRVGLSPVVSFNTLPWTSDGNITATEITATGFLLHWYTLNGSNLLYRLWVDGKLITTTASSNASVTGLTSDQSHNIQIEVYCGSVRVALSPVVSYSTWSGKITATDISTTGFTLNWTPCNGAYLYYVWVDGKQLYSIDYTSVVITGLSSNQNHNVQIEAYQYPGSPRVGLTPVVSFTTSALKSAYVASITPQSELITENKPIEKDILFYPNPANNIINVDIDESRSFEINIFSESGTKIKTLQDSKQIDVSSLPAGIYYIKIKCGNIEKIQKIIKQ